MSTCKYTNPEKFYSNPDPVKEEETRAYAERLSEGLIDASMNPQLPNEYIMEKDHKQFRVKAGQVVGNNADEKAEQTTIDIYEVLSNVISVLDGRRITVEVAKLND